MTSQQTTHSVPRNNVTDTDLLLVKLASFDLQRPTLTRTRSNLLLNFLFQGAHCKCLYLPNVCPPTATTSIDGLACMALRFNGNNYRQGCNFRPIKRRLGRKDGRELSSCKLQHSFRCEPVDVCWPVSLSIVHHNNNNINITVQCTHGSRKQLLCAGRVPEMAGSVWRGSSSTT